jgi:DNA ligase (NAD+)
MTEPTWLEQAILPKVTNSGQKCDSVELEAEESLMSNDLVQKIRTTFNVADFDPSKIGMPLACPACGTPLDLNPDSPAFVWCPNLACQQKVYGNILKFINTFDLKNVGDTTIQELTAKGYVTRPSDLFKVTEAQFTSVERKGSKQFTKMQASLKEFAATPQKLFKILAGLNVTHAGEGAWETICEAIQTPEELTQILSQGTDYSWVSKVSNLPRIQDRTVKSIWTNREYVVTELAELLTVLTLKTVVQGGPLSGMKFCQTGSLVRLNPKTGKRIVRNELAALIEVNGGLWSDGVDKATILIADDPNGSSSKIQKAKKYGCKILTEEEFFNLL